MGGTDTWVPSPWFNEVIREEPEARSWQGEDGSGKFKTRVLVTSDCEDTKNLASCTKPFVIDYVVNNDQRTAARVTYEILDVDECTGKYWDPVSKKEKALDVGAEVKALSLWGKAACESDKHSHCVNMNNGQAPFKCVCNEHWDKAGSDAYTKLSADAEKLFTLPGKRVFPNLMPLGYNSKTAGVGCHDNQDPVVTCTEPDAVFEISKVGCDCLDEHLATTAQWKPTLDAYSKKLDLAKLCTVEDNDDDGVMQKLDHTQYSGLSFVSELTFVDPDCKPKDEECWATIKVGAKDAKGNAAEPFVLKFKFYQRDSMYMMEKRLTEKIQQVADAQLEKTGAVQRTVDDTSIKINNLNSCTTDLCRLLQMVKFSRLVWLFLFICLVNGVHTSIVRALFVGTGMGKFYYPNDEHKFQDGADLWLRMTRLGFMCSQERVDKVAEMWSDMGEEDLHEE